MHNLNHYLIHMLQHVVSIIISIQYMKQNWHRHLNKTSYSFEENNFFSFKNYTSRIFFPTVASDEKTTQNKWFFY